MFNPFNRNVIRNQVTKVFKNLIDSAQKEYDQGVKQLKADHALTVQDLEIIHETEKSILAENLVKGLLSKIA